MDAEVSTFALTFPFWTDDRGEIWFTEGEYRFVAEEFGIIATLLLKLI